MIHGGKEREKNTETVFPEAVLPKMRVQQSFGRTRGPQELRKMQVHGKEINTSIFDRPF